jgi:hypothetical protein
MPGDVLAMQVTPNRLACTYTGLAHSADMHMRINSGQNALIDFEQAFFSTAEDCNLRCHTNPRAISKAKLFCTMPFFSGDELRALNKSVAEKVALRENRTGENACHC